MREPTWEFDTTHILGASTTFPGLWYDLNQSRSLELDHRAYDELDFEEQMAAWLISGAIVLRLPFDLQERCARDGAWLRMVERTKPAIVALVGTDYRECAWFAGKVLALEEFAKHCNHCFPGNSNHALSENGENQWPV